VYIVCVCMCERDSKRSGRRWKRARAREKEQATAVTMKYSCLSRSCTRANNESSQHEFYFAVQQSLCEVQCKRSERERERGEHGTTRGVREFFSFFLPSIESFHSRNFFSLARLLGIEMALNKRHHYYQCERRVK
jgi:type IV secretory pathway TrbF-like protein